MKRNINYRKWLMAGMTFAMLSAAAAVPVMADADLAQADADALEVFNSEDVAGNLYLPLEGENGSVITWESSDEAVITSQAEGAVAAGKVTRQPAATMVTLTATITNGEDVVTKEFECNVRKAAEVPELTDYLFSYFPYTSFKDERVYFGISEDGLNFDSLNNGKYVLESHVGTHGIRDPFVIRSHEGDKFYMIATDLTVAGLTQDGKKYPGMGWSDNQVRGSKSIVVWESEDLVNWSEERLCKVSVDNAGCTWAPEAYWDDETEQYVVFWASKTGTDNYAKQRVYFATTRDFHTFSDAQVWIEERGSVIDTTVIKVDDYYYRYTKNEDGSTNAYGTPSKRIYAERSKSLTSTDWEVIGANSLNISGGQIEGGCIFKINTEDAENARNMAALKGFNMTGDDIYCLAADRTGATIFPGLSDDITTGSFNVLGTGSNAQVNGVTLYSMPDPVASHGTIMPITSEEYDRVMKAYDEAYAAKALDYSELADILLEDVEVDTRESLDAITKDVELMEDVYGEAFVTWQSSDENVISNTGVVTRPSFEEGDIVVELTATMTMPADEGVRDQVRRVTFQLTVKAEEEPEPTPTPEPTPGIDLPYEDVAETDWFYDAVEYTFVEGLMTGMDPTHFGPYGQLSRAQFALILHRMEDEVEVDTDKTFGDITGDEWYGPAVLWAAENGIVTGYQDGNFGPADMITREQMAVMMYRYAKYLGKAVATEGDFSAFEDAASVSEFAAEAIGWATESGIITGKENGTKIDPQGNTARSEAAIILQRFCTAREEIVSFDILSEDDVISDIVFEGPVVINSREDGGKISFFNCVFEQGATFNGEVGNVVMFGQDCSFAEGTSVTIACDEREATLETMLPRVMTFVPVNVNVENMGTVVALLQDALMQNDTVLQIHNCDYALSEDGNSFVEFDPNAEYDCLAIAKWWENGEMIEVSYAFKG